MSIALSLLGLVPNMTTSAHLLLVLAMGLSTAWCFQYFSWKRRSHGLPLPPGPKRLPLLGNFMDMPNVKHPWVVYRDWASVYGDMVFVQVLQTRMLIVSSIKVAYDLMEDRSKIYSDRPVSIMDEITGWAFNVALMPYGQRWRDIRRHIHHYFNPVSTKQFRPRQLVATRAFLRRFTEHPGDLTALAFRYTLTSIIMDVVFSVKITSMEDEHLRNIIDANDFFNESRSPAMTWIEIFPALRYIPAWLPGGIAQTLGNRARPVIEGLRNEPYNTVKTSKSWNECMALDLIRKAESEGDDAQRAVLEERAKDAIGVIYPTAVDTTTSLLSFFACAMAMHPEIQIQAQRQLDEVVGRDRLPDFDDYDALPLIHAILLETARWIPTGPLGVPHSVTTDDYYNGYFIPKGTMIIPNVWAMLHDPDIYDQPEAFVPDRFLKAGTLDPNVRDPMIAFGFGRRVCPGRFFALDEAFIAAASILHVFDIEAATDEHGHRIDPAPGQTSGILTHPERMACVLKPRNKAAEQLVLSSVPPDEA